MKTICLVVQGGKFLVGISAEDVLARTAWAEAALLRRPGRKIFQLGALLSRQPGGAVPPDAVCLELQGKNEIFWLIADKVADEAEVINPPGPLPSSCPPLAARLCPQVTVWGDTPVLLLDPAQVIPVAHELGKGIGLLAEEPEAAAEAEPDLEMETAPEEEPDDPFFPVREPERPAAAASSAGDEVEETDEPEGPVASLAEEQAGVPDSSSEAGSAAGSSAAAKEERQARSAAAESGRKESSAIDEETFRKVMIWTVGRFKQQRAGEVLHLGIEQMPSELAGMVAEKGLNKNIIQYLIDQIVLRCKESGKNAGRRLPGDNHAG